MQCQHRIFFNFHFPFCAVLFHQIVKFSPFCAVLSSTILYVMSSTILFLITESVYYRIAHAHYSPFRIRKIEDSKYLMGNDLSSEGVSMSGALPLQS